jgi:hypothetical protein
VTILGRNLAFSPKACCVFGDRDRSPAEFKSDAEVTCLTPSSRAFDYSSTVIVTLSRDCLQLIPSTQTFAFSLPLRVHSSAPLSGPSSGGTKVQLNISGAENSTVFCCFGERECSSLNNYDNLALRSGIPPFVKQGIHRGEYLVCDSPSLLSNSVRGTDDSPVSAAIFISTNMGANWQSTGYYFSFLRFHRQVSFSPQSGSYEGGFHLLITSTIGFDAYSSSLYCRITDEKNRTVSIAALWETRSRISCLVPSMAQGSCVVEVSSNEGADFTAIPGRLVLHGPAQAISVQPRVVYYSGGSVLHVSGKGFRFQGKPECRFSPLLSYSNLSTSEPSFVSSLAQVVSINEVRCLSPSSSDLSRIAGNSFHAIHLNKRIGISLSLMLGYDSDSSKDDSLSIQMVPAPEILSVSPSRTLSTGGTKITLSGMNFEQNKLSVRLVPVLGNRSVVPLKDVIVISSSLAHCTVQSVDEGVWQLHATTTGVDFSSSYLSNTPVLMVFSQPLVVDRISPTLEIGRAHV